VDKAINRLGAKIKKDASKEEKQVKKLAAMDRKRDKVCDLGERMLKKKK